MATATDTNAFEQVLDNVRRATESTLKMQQEAFQQWTSMWSGFPTPQSVGAEKIKDLQTQWANTVSELAHQHRNTLDRQYQAAIESLDEALRVGQSSNPEEYRKRTEQFCRKALDCMRDASEAQVKEYQDAMNKLSELVAKMGS